VIKPTSANYRQRTYDGIYFEMHLTRWLRKSGFYAQRLYPWSHKKTEYGFTGDCDIFAFKWRHVTYPYVYLIQAHQIRPNKWTAFNRFKVRDRQELKYFEAYLPHTCRLLVIYSRVRGYDIIIPEKGKLEDYEPFFKLNAFYRYSDDSKLYHQAVYKTRVGNQERKKHDYRHSEIANLRT